MIRNESDEGDEEFCFGPLGAIGIEGDKWIQGLGRVKEIFGFGSSWMGNRFG
jgi:hypothetical protein